MEWTLIVQDGKYINTGSSSMYEYVERLYTGRNVIHIGKRRDGSWFASFNGSGGSININIDVDNMDDAKVTALALWRMR